MGQENQVAVFLFCHRWVGYAILLKNNLEFQMGQENQVAVFIDYDNIEISVEEAFGKAADVDWSRIFQAATQLGRVVMRRAYADWAESAAKHGRRVGACQQQTRQECRGHSDCDRRSGIILQR